MKLALTGEQGIDWMGDKGDGQQKKAHGEVVRGRNVVLREDGDAIIVNGVVVEKPFVEKVSRATRKRREA